MATLTAATAARLKRPGRYAAGDGLYLVVTNAGGKSWVLRMQSEGRRIDRGLGPLSTTTMGEARRKAKDLRAALKAGGLGVIPPRTGKSTAPTFREAAIALHSQLKGGWSDIHGRKWLEAMDRHVFPELGSMAVDEITRQDCLRVLAPMWVLKPVTAARLRQQMRSTFAWAQSWELRDDNPCGEALDGALPRQRRVIQHLAALHYSQVELALSQLWTNPRTRIQTKLQLAFVALTAARPGEVRGMTWNELHECGTVWEIPADRMKTGKRHRVPVSLQAQRVLAWAWRLAFPLTSFDRKLASFGLAPFDQTRTTGPADRVFQGHGNRPMRGSTAITALRSAGLDSTTHGFRSSFRDWAAEQSGASHSAIELSLAHAVGGPVEAAYFRADMLENRRELMQQWADYIAPTDDATPADWTALASPSRNMPLFG